MAKFKFESLKFEQIMEDYATIREVTIPDAVMLNARLLCVELGRRTQPFGADEKAKLTGEKAITRDLVGGRSSSAVHSTRRIGIFGIIGGAMDERGGFKWYKESENVRLFIGKDGFAYGTEKSFFQPDASLSSMRAWHKKFFVNGKMSSAGSRDRTIGRWKFLDKLFVTEATMNAYKESVLKKVGIAKAGWASCALKLKKVNKGSLTAGFPKWVTRHTGDFDNGRVQDMTANLKNPKVEITNAVPWASTVIPASEQLNALSVVSTKMKNQMNMILKKRQKGLIET